MTGSSREPSAEDLLAELASTDPDHPRHKELRDQVVTMHWSLAHQIAARFAGRGESVDDLAQVAGIGLIKAVDRYDAARGQSFAAYAVPTMMGEVKRHFRDHAWSVRLPRRLSELYVTLGRATRDLSQDLGRAPTPSQLAEHLDITVAEVQEVLEAAHAYRASSLDSGGGDVDGGDQLALGERLGDEDREFHLAELRAVLGPALETVPERERRIVAMRFFEHLTQTQIADRLGLSQMHVSRLLTRTLQTLRRRMAEVDRSTGG